MLVNDEAGRTLEANNQVASLLGCEQEQLRALSWIDLFADSNRELAQTILNSAFETGQAKPDPRMLCAGAQEINVAVAAKRFELQARLVLDSVVPAKSPPTAVASAPATPPSAATVSPEASRLKELNMLFSLSQNGLALLDETQRGPVANPAFASFMEHTVSPIVGMSD